MKAISLEEATTQWAKAILRVPREASLAHQINRKAFQDMIGQTPEEYLKASLKAEKEPVVRCER